MILINPLDVLLWTVRRNEKDVVSLYSKLSPIMQLATGGSMLNFGLWDKTTNNPLSAQENLCTYISEIAELRSASIVADIGSGLTSPANFWKKSFPKLRIICVNLNLQQLQDGFQTNIDLINSTSTRLPFAKKSMDRILALESAQHFKPLKKFVSDSKSALKDSGYLVLAIPITRKKPSFFKLGMLNLTWSSEHYSLKYVKETIYACGFEIIQQNLVGRNVYEPLANYYLTHRNRLQKSILKKYPKFIESVLFHSIKKMKHASENGIIDYLILKCT